ncbi:MAG: amidohydrolase family protein [Gaiella sp.]|nr:amidohydrolase family protein [Gaiella sp.]
MTTALAHGLVLTLDPERTILRDGTVAFDEDGTIVAVGPSRETLASLRPGTEVVDCSRCVLTPGFVDAHAHLGEEVMRGLVPDAAPPDEWLPRWLLPAYAALTPEDERLSAELGIAQMLLTGTTTFCEAGTLLDWRSAADVVVETGIRGQLGRWAWDLPPEPAAMRRTTDEVLAACEDLVTGVRATGSARLTGAVILLGIGTASPALLTGAAALAGRLDAPLATMYASVAPEHGGTSLPLAALGEAGWLAPRTKLTHAVYVSEADVAELARAGVSVAHCPTAALRHVKGIHRHGLVPEMLAQGIPVALGGDSANGSNHLDVLRLMYLAATLYKDFRMDPTMVPPETALEMATLHGARALGLADEIGSLEPGKRADVVVFSTDHPEWRPLLHPVQNLVLTATDRSIESVWVDGRKVVDRGTLLTIDLPRLLERVDSAAAALLDRIGLQAPWTWPAR